VFLKSKLTGLFFTAESAKGAENIDKTLRSPRTLR
jgi:hypothetical protein